MTTKSEKLRVFVLQYLDGLDRQGGGGTVPKLPTFELYAQDYLAFAEQELDAYQLESDNRRRTAGLINCVSHLKRALDCQIDTFLHVFNLYKKIEKKNLGIDRKLDFLKQIGVFSSRSLSRLNSIRNKMEHEFEVPKIANIEAFFDLVSAFVAILQLNIMNSLNSEFEYIIFNDNNDDKAEQIGYFRLDYKFNKPSIKAHWVLNDGIEETIECNLDDYKEFAFFFKVLLLLPQQEGFASNEYIISQLRAT